MLSYYGAREFQGKPVYDILTRYTDGTSEEVFVDRQTFLIDGVAQDIQFHAFGHGVASIIEQDDYRPVGGVSMPFQSHQIDVNSGSTLDATIVTSAHANTGLTPKDFMPPVFTPTVLQAMIAAIFEERDDPKAVIQTYSDYRQRLKLASVSTVDAVDFVGF